MRPSLLEAAGVSSALYKFGVRRACWAWQSLQPAIPITAPLLWLSAVLLTLAGPWPWCAVVAAQTGGAQQLHGPKVDDDGLPLALLFSTRLNRGKPLPTLDKAIRSAVVEHAPVHLEEDRAEPLSALQAAVHCREDTVECMRAVASKASVEVLIVPSVERGAGELTLTFMAFDARADAIARVAHWQDGADIRPETIAALPDLIAGLFPEPGPPDIDFVAEAKANAESAAGPVDGASGAKLSLLAPILVAGAGALLIGAGVVTGLMLRSTQADYDTTDIRTRTDARAADDLHAEASTQATVANVFYGLGGVALVASGTWLAIEWLGSSEEPAQQTHTRLSPWVAPRQVGIVVRHQGGWF